MVINPVKLYSDFTPKYMTGIMYLRVRLQTPFYVEHTVVIGHILKFLKLELVNVKPSVFELEVVVDTGYRLTASS